jgi:hypothetical protein
MTDLRQAAQQALEALEHGFMGPRFIEYQAAIAAIKEALAQLEQEPVAWMSSDKAWMWSDYSKALAAVAHNPRLTLIPLYTTPPQRPWVGLTDAEISQLWISTSPYFNEDDFAKAIEAKLKEKNT